MKDENEVWELLDAWLRAKANNNEAITSGWALRRDCMKSHVRISYSRIEDNKLTSHYVDIEMSFLRIISSVGLDSILADIVENLFRKDYCND